MNSTNPGPGRDEDLLEVGILDVEALERVDRRARELLGQDPDAAEALLGRTLERLALAAAGHGGAAVSADVDLAHWRAQLLYARSAQRHYRNDPDALADLQQAAEIVDPVTSPLLAALVLNGRSIWEGFEGHVEQQIHTLTQALEILPDADPDRSVPVRVALRINLAEILADLGDVERALSLLSAAMPDSQSLGDPEQLEHSYATAVTVAGLWLLRPDGVERAPQALRADLEASVQQWARAATEAGEAAAARYPVVSNRRHATYAGARAAHVRGDLDLALALAQTAVELTSERGEPDHLLRCRALAGELLAHLGRHEEAVALLQLVVSSTGRMTTAIQLTAWYVLADCLEALGRPREAMTALQQYVQHSRASRDVRLRNTAALAAVNVMRERAEAERDIAMRDSEQASRMRRLDALTGIGNRLAFEDTLAELAAQGRSICLALLDLDHFKAVNDAHGHLVGDGVLRDCAASMRSQLAGSDPDAELFRIGGEEFAAVLSHQGPDALASAVRVLEGLRVAVAETRTPASTPSTTTISVTVSAGLAIGTVGAVGDHTHRALLSHADQNLYRAKRRGRDRVVAD